jgi:hypothetical protein
MTSSKKILELAVRQPLAPNQKLIDLLRDVLKEAKAGKIHALGIAVGTVDENGDNGRSSETILSASDGWYHTLAAAVGGLAFRLNYERYTQGSKIPPSELTEQDE